MRVAVEPSPHAIADQVDVLHPLRPRCAVTRRSWEPPRTYELLHLGPLRSVEWYAQRDETLSRELERKLNDEEARRAATKVQAAHRGKISRQYVRERHVAAQSVLGRQFVQLHDDRGA